MIYVVDASIAVKWFVYEDLYEKAEALLESGADLFAPEIVIAEVTNTAWAKVMRREIDEAHAHYIASTIRRAPPTLHPAIDLNESALGIALQLAHPIYDCFYLACAEITGGIVVTADKRFLRAVENTAFVDLVYHLDDISP